MWHWISLQNSSRSHWLTLALTNIYQLSHRWQRPSRWSALKLPIKPRRIPWKWKERSGAPGSEGPLKRRKKKNNMKTCQRINLTRSRNPLAKKKRLLLVKTECAQALLHQSRTLFRSRRHNKHVLLWRAWLKLRSGYPMTGTTLKLSPRFCLDKVTCHPTSMRPSSMISNQLHQLPPSKKKWQPVSHTKPNAPDNIPPKKKKKRVVKRWLTITHTSPSLWQRTHTKATKTRLTI